MRWRSLVVLAMALQVTQAGRAEAHVGSVLYPVFEISPMTPVDIDDGTIEDWEEIADYATVTSIDLYSVYGQEGLDPGDLAVEVYLGWEAATGRIYFALQRFDDDYFNEYDPGAERGIAAFNSIYWYDNSVLMIDADHSGGQYDTDGPTSADEEPSEDLKRFRSAQAQHYAIIAESPNGQLIQNTGYAYLWVSRPPWSDARGTVVESSPDYSLVEGYVTAWDNLQYQGEEVSQRGVLAAGRVIGFQIGVSDYDDGALQGYTAIAGVGDAWRNADSFVDGMLLCSSCNLPQGGSAVQADSWGRIKAAARQRR